MNTKDNKKQSSLCFEGMEHSAIIYETEAEHKAVVSKWIVDGLKQKKKVLYILDNHSRETITGYLKESGLDLKQYLDSGQLQIIPQSELYVIDGNFDPDRIVSFYKSEIKKAKDSHFSGVNISVEMSWMKSFKPGDERLLSYRMKMSDLIQESKISLLCQFNKNTFSAEMLLAVIRNHSTLFIGSEKISNLASLSAEEYPNPDSAEAILSHTIKSLIVQKNGKARFEALEDEFLSLAEAQSIWIWETDKEGIYNYSNTKVKDFFGIDKNEIVGKISFDFLPEAFAKAVKITCEELMAGKMLQKQIENRVLDKEGHEVFFESTICVLFDSERNHKGFRGTVKDITEKKHENEQIEKNKVLFENISRMAPVGIFRTDEHGLCTYVNEKWLEIASLKPQEALGEGWTNGLYPEDKETVFKVWANAIKNNYNFKLEYRFGKPYSKITWVLGQAMAEKDSDGKITGYVGTITDITERKKYETQISESEEKIRTIIESNRDIIFSLDSGGFVKYISPQISKYGYNEEDLMEHKFDKFIHPQDVVSESNIFKQILEFDLATPPHSFRFKKKDGQFCYLEALSRKRVLDNGSVEVISTVRDVTSRIRSEKALSIINKTFLSFGPNPLENIGRMAHAAGEILEAVCVLYNRKEGDMLHTLAGWQIPRDMPLSDKGKGHICFDVIDNGGDEPFVLDNLQESSYMNTDPNVKKYGLKTYAGFAVKVGTQAVGAFGAVYQDDRKFETFELSILKIMGLAVSIEEERLADKDKIVETSRLFSSITQLAPVGIYRKDIEDKYVYTNKRWGEISGLSCEEALGDGWKKALYPQDKSYVDKEWENSVATGKPYRLEYRFLRTDGTISWVLDRLLPEKDKEGNITGYIGAITDLTGIKELKAKLDKSEENYKNILESTVDIIQVVDFDGTIKFCSPQIEQLGDTVENAVGRNVAEIVHPEDRKMLFDAFESVAKGNDGGSVVARYKKPNGEYVSLEGSGKLSRDRFNNPQMTVVLRDVSERIEYEKKLAFRTIVMETQIHLSPDAVLVVDREAKPYLHNKKFIELFDTPEDFLSQKGQEKVWKMLTEKIKDHESFFEKIKYLYSQPKEVGSGELEMKNGMFVKWNSVPLFDKKKNFNYGRAWFFSDITNSKKENLDLSLLSKNLENKTIALKELLAQVEIEKKEFGENLLKNIERTARPLIGKIRRMKVPKISKYLEMLEKDLDNLASPFGKIVESPRTRLSPREVEICNMIRNGYKNAKIAKILKVSGHTIQTHRRAIRKKLGIGRKKINLSTYLQQGH
ncbi:PAS domain S-box protein [Elusimicrobiota bacterium]